MCIELRCGHANLLCPHYTVTGLHRCLDIRFSSTPRAACPPERRDVYIALRPQGELCAWCAASVSAITQLELETPRSGVAVEGDGGIAPQGIGQELEGMRWEVGGAGGFEGWRLDGGVEWTATEGGETELRAAAAAAAAEGAQTEEDGRTGGMVLGDVEELVNGVVEEGVVVDDGQRGSRTS